MKRKKKAFTLIEMIITLAITVMIIEIVSSIFITGNKIFSDSDIKSTLQIEAQKIQEEISNIGMQSVNIEEYKESINGENIANKEYADLLNYEEFINLWEAKFECYSKDTEYDSENNVLTNVERRIISYNKALKTLSVDSKVISKNVESIQIRPNNIKNTNSTIDEANSIEFNIILTKKKVFSDIVYPINFAVTFRNNRG